MIKCKLSTINKRDMGNITMDKQTANNRNAAVFNSAYTFLGRQYQDIPSLITALAKNWDEGKKQLYQSLTYRFFKDFDADIANLCKEAEIEAASNSNDDVVYWNLLYEIYPELNGFHWKGQSYHSLTDLGYDMLKRLQKNDESNYPYWDGILNNKLLTSYLSKTEIRNTELTSVCSALETAHGADSRSDRETLVNYRAMAYLLSGQRLFMVGNKQIKDVSELANYMKTLLDSSYEKFEGFCHNLIDYNDSLDARFEAWLISLGKKKELDAWKASLTG